MPILEALSYQPSAFSQQADEYSHLRRSRPAFFWLKADGYS
jgi:hypothetical protein